MKSVIDVYSELVVKYPKWTSEQESEFIRSCIGTDGKWRDKNRFVNEAFKRNLGLMFSIVQKTAFQKRNEDIIQKAVIAMVEALKKYDPSKGVKISTWLTNPIRWAVIQTQQGTYSKDKTIAEEIGGYNHRYNLKMSVVSIDAKIGNSDEQDTVGSSISEFSVHPDYANLRGFNLGRDAESNAEEIRSGVEELISTMGDFLTKREVVIVKGLLEGKTMAEIGESMNLCKMRISQLTAVAFEKIRASKIGKRLKAVLSSDCSR